MPMSYVRTEAYRALQGSNWTPEKWAAHATHMRMVMSAPDVRRRIAEAKLAQKNPNWVGDAIGIKPVHDWVKRRLPRPSACSRCQKSGPVDLANISQEYLRDLTDWEWLCRLCHMSADGRRDQLIARNRSIARR